MALLGIPVSVSKTSRHLTAPNIYNGGVTSLSSMGFVKRKRQPMKNKAATVGSPSIDREREGVKYRKHPAWESVKQERWEGELEIEGQIPQWLNGTYLRNGPGVFDIGDEDSESFFDGLGDGRVICLTETIKGTIEINPNTLETIGPFIYTDKLGGLIHLAHPIVFNSDFISLLPDFINPGYHVIRRQAGTNQRDLIGKVNCKSGRHVGWVHSIAITDNYIIIPEMSMKYSLKNILNGELLQWNQDSKAFMHVVSKETGDTVFSIEVPKFMAFHFINAYEEKDKASDKVISIILDCCEFYGNVEILERLRLQELRSYNGNDILPNSRLGRFTIPLNGSQRGTLETAIPPKEHGRGIDMCTINPKYVGKMYRYTYGCGAKSPCYFVNCLIKIDLKEKSTKIWYEEGSIPSEPFFIAHPRENAEDDGVVISIVTCEDGDGFVVVLDGSTFIEIARAKLPYGLPYGLHGCWIPSL